MFYLLKYTLYPVRIIIVLVSTLVPLPSFNFNLIITISPTTLSYTSNQLIVTDDVLRTPPPLLKFVSFNGTWRQYKKRIDEIVERKDIVYDNQQHDCKGIIVRCVGI